ncbi:MAG: MarR family transcriptional regulator [Actinomycetota bacterium]|nr:MarR family transcriptional regulator [Actinomycetota bacterium]
MAEVQRQTDGTLPLPSRVLDDPRHQAANRLHSMAIQLLRAARVEDAALGITPERLSVLSVLVYGGPTLLGRLAAIEQVTPPAITRHVDALERDGLAGREAVAGDRRAIRVRATPAGRRLVERGRRSRIRAVAAMLAEFDERSLAEVDRVSSRLLARLNPH